MGLIPYLGRYRFRLVLHVSSNPNKGVTNNPRPPIAKRG